jgi:predicted alpha/beta hydrolase family esterase
MNAAVKQTTTLAIVAAGLALLVACSGGQRDAAPRTSPHATETTAAPSPQPVWIAVFQSAQDPNDLESAAEELMNKVGTAVVVAPEGCFGGLQGHGDVRPGEYVLAVMADSKEGVDTAVRRVEERPLVTQRVEDLCPV